MKKYKTAESVCKGHPDKLCDIIADSILDECLMLDKSSRVACEVMATGHKIIVAGEITCSKYVNIRSVVRRVLCSIGYNPFAYLIYVYLHKQSPDIKNGVDVALEHRQGDTTKWYGDLGAGDQGTVYGYATDECAEMIPLSLMYAHKICERLDSVMSDGIIKGIGPDGKAQVTIEYEDEQPKRVSSIIVSVQHKKDVQLKQLRADIISNVLWPVFEQFPFDDDTEILINPSGRFVKGGPAADTGLTGRKIIVDTYGGHAAHGGGAFSGKDPTKVDRSGAYMARAIARNIVACGFAKRCQVAISYAIGKADPVAVEIDTFGTSIASEEMLKKAVLEVYNLRPAAIIEALGLRRPIYADTACYGHFGRLAKWEYYSKLPELRKAVYSYGD